MSGASRPWVGMSIEFDGLEIRFDDRVLRPRPWTAEQSRWAADLLDVLPSGPVLELCSGAGQIGLAAVRRSSRRLVCVDVDRVAALFTAQNAGRAGLAERVEVRASPMSDALDPHEQFALIMADPPWVTRDAIGQFPEDPVAAIDGGPDGLAPARECLDVIGRHLMGDGEALLQLGSLDQVEALEREIASAGLLLAECRVYDGGVVARLAPA